MRGDFSRLPAGAGAAYARVLMQQGRLQTDADLNAQAHLAAEAHAAALRDLLGPAGGPTDAGFGLRGHGGFRFDGHAHGVTIEHPRDVRVSGGFTVEGWVKRDDDGPAVLVEHPHDGRPDHTGFALDIDGEGRLRFRLQARVVLDAVVAVVDDTGVTVEEVIETAPGVELVSDAPLAVGRFVHVAAVASEAHVRLYVDGVEAAEHARAVALPFAAAPVRIGRDLRGVIDDLHLWRAAMGPELLHLRAAGTPVSDLVDIEPEWRLTDMVRTWRAAREEAFASRMPTPAELELVLGAGRYYLDGIASRLAHDCRLDLQPEGPGVAAPSVAVRRRRPGPWTAWLEAVEVVVTAHEDEALRDPAFGDADTSARLRTVSRVRLAPGDEDEVLARAHPRAGALAVERTPHTQLGEPSLLRIEIHDAGYAAGHPGTHRRRREGFRLHHLSPDGWATLDDDAFGHEHLWRRGRPVELVHGRHGHAVALHVTRVDADGEGRTRLRLHAEEGAELDSGVPVHAWRLRPVATFKWSYDNAAFASRVTAFETDEVLHLDDVAERAAAVAAGDHVELGDLELTLRRRPAAIGRVAELQLTEEEDALRLTLDGPAPDPLGEAADALLARGPVLRRWDGVEGPAGAAVVRVSTDGPVRLGQGVQVRFTSGHHQTGEAWTCAVRDRLEWPTDAEGAPLALAAPHGRTRSAAVARLAFGPAGVEVHDLRRLFAPLAHRRRWESLRVERDPGTLRSETDVETVEVTDAPAPAPAPAAVEMVEVVEIAPAPPPLPPGVHVLTARMHAGAGLHFTGAHLSSRRPEPRWQMSEFRPPFDGALAAAALAGRVAVLSRTGELALLDPAERLWELRAPMALTGFDATTVTVLDGGLHVMGFDGAYGRTWHLRYDPEADVWDELTPLPGARRRFCACAAGERLYAAGGFMDGAKTPCDAFDSYDPAQDAWTRRPRLHHAVARASLTAWEGRVHLLGGVGARPPTLGVHPLRRTAVFSPSADAWTEGPQLPHPRFNHVSVATASRIHLLGGEGEGGRAAAAEALDPAAMAWMEQPQPALGGRLAAAVVDGAIHLLRAGDVVSETEIETCRIDDVYYVQALA